ncbi:GIN domain-containing protein [Phenylobacterium kunshanense]|uniref:Putative auto-transporter adhesin head GIN domain-containing protein n=1 Tax=Phenylobacterium kunshanense TaxID=1445034 RepID=A0A328BT81_9CAUL|nr:DUF2807 domain-containing protein [Phenylobacterium kunshanense]RAK69226.1 hypothetical protein DJ019_04280 [Phenylobacterium kunshanense]
MRLYMVALATSAAMAAGSAQAASVEIRDAVARVTIVPEDRGDVKVEVVKANSRAPLTVRTLPGGRTIVDGDFDRRIRNCRGSYGKAVVTVRDVGDIAWDEMPQVVIHTPRQVDVEAGGAVFGSVGRSSTLKVSNAGCGDWTIANVAGEARVNQAGSGDARMGSTGALKVHVTGSGDVAAGDVKGGLDVTIAGSGSTAVRSIAGPLEVNIAGSGDVEIASGRATTMKVSIAGSGDIGFRGVADSVQARIAGSGDVSVREVKGEISKTVMGSGSVRVGD